MAYSQYKNTSKRKLENYDKKKTTQFFKDQGVTNSIENDDSSVNFLDFNFNLDTLVYQTYHKPNANIRYINVNSNHPRYIKENLSTKIERRINFLSFNEQVFNKQEDYQNIILKKAGNK